MQLGYALIAEEHPAPALVDAATRAEAAGFDYLSISDHFHPWLDVQGESPFAWTVLGALASETTVPLVTAVTCPTTRYHPAIVAQAAATVASLAPRRFSLGLGTGEALNEHITGEPWPSAGVRLEKLDEAIQVIRSLLAGREVTHHGEHVTVDRARLYSLPMEPPTLVVAAGGPDAARLAARNAAELMCVSPDAELIAAHRDAGGDGGCWGQATVCWARDEASARAIVHKRWRQSAVGGWDALSDIPTPAALEQAVHDATEEAAVGGTPCGPELGPLLDEIRAYVEAGFDRVALHQVGPDQDGFLSFAADELLPAVRSLRS